MCENCLKLEADLAVKVAAIEWTEKFLRCNDYTHVAGDLHSRAFPPVEEEFEAIPLTKYAIYVDGDYKFCLDHIPDDLENVEVIKLTGTRLTPKRKKVKKSVTGFRNIVTGEFRYALCMGEAEEYWHDAVLTWEE